MDDYVPELLPIEPVELFESWVDYGPLIALVGVVVMMAALSVIAKAM